MNVSCPECHSVFRVDPSRVPGPGVRARCSVCGGIIPITSARSWTDDFATPHDAASLTAATSRTGSAFGASGATSHPASEVRPSAGPAGSRLTPPAGAPRSATPARVPPFAPGRRPTPPAAPSVPPVASVVPPAIRQETRSVPPAAPPAAPVAAATGAATMPPAKPPARPDTARPAAAPGGIGRVPDSLSAPVAPRSATIPPVPAPQAAARTADSPSVPSSPAAVRPGVAATTPSKAPINPFLANDPNQKAKRLARALVSDMVAYHPQKLSLSEVSALKLSRTDP